ncbi:MAG: NAD(P)H-binding protein, partial [Candidatus Marinimicrobia bacterium]|nr:NAD(P)H-binding protein [Candidatus Neomarinimicrobiota bacterium]
MNETRPRTALLVGASGLVGSHCLKALLARREYQVVTALVRRPLPIEHPKLVQQVSDFEQLEEREGLFKAEDIFCCLGTTMKKAGSQEAFTRVDHDYPLEVARLAVRQGARQFLMVSALGAD